MKKILLSAVALVATMSVNAQEYCAFDAESNTDFAALNLDTETANALNAGTVLGKTESVTCLVGADDSYKKSSLGSMTLGAATYNGGTQGSNNPKEEDGGSPATTLKAPVSGAYFVFDVKADGYLYVTHKASSNKQYTVFEEGKPLGYTFSAVGDASTALGAQYGYTLTGDAEFNYLSADNLTGGIIQWAEKIALNWDGTSEWTDIKKNGMGVIKFQVFAGCKYIVNACGSKMSSTGFYFDTTGDATVIAGDVTLLENGQLPGSSTGISAATVELNKNGQIVNIAGQKVNDSFKGIVIKNGKKFIQK